MRVVNLMNVCTRKDIIFPICVILLLLNFLVFSRYSIYLTNPLRLFAPTVSHELSTKLGTRELVAYIQTQEFSKDYNDHEIMSSVHSVLTNLAKNNGLNLLIVRKLLYQIHNFRDVTQLLAELEHINSSLSEPHTEDEKDISYINKSLKLTCPDKPPGLLGNVGSNLASIVPEFLETNYASLNGGHYAPDACGALEKLAIIIPYRNRYAHLHILLNNLLPVLIRQQLDFRIFVIEQAMPTIFNRCMLFNIGYLEALKMDDFDCFIFHDVDMILLNDHCLYRCAEHPQHLTAAISKWKYSIPYKTYFGGVVAFTRRQFKDINGCSNLYFGWGGEDDDLRSRIKLVESSQNKVDTQGLNTTVYQVTAIDLKTLYTWIHVEINMTQVLQTAPKHMQSDISNMMKLTRHLNYSVSKTEMQNKKNKTLGEVK